VVQLAWNTWQALPSALAGALFHAWQQGGSFEAAWKGAAITTLAPLTHHLLKALPIVPYDGKLGPIPAKKLPPISDRPTSHRSVPPPTYPGAAAALLLAGALALIGALPACSHGPNLPLPTTGSAAREVAKGVYTGSVLAVRALDEVNSAWMRALPSATPEQLDVARKVTATLLAARDALREAKPYIETGGSGVEKLREGLRLLTFAATLLDAQGVKVPAELTEVLQFVDGYAQEQVSL
jgi:hypothetical protein